jgi:CRP-like cAMP-binding protein
MHEMMTLIEKTAFLKSTDLFTKIPTEVVAQMATRTRELHVEAGEALFREGEMNSGAYLVVEGLIEIRKGRALDRVRGPGEGFGELGLGEGEPHLFSAIAAQPSYLLNVSNEKFFEGMLDFPEMAIAMVRILSQRIGELAQRTHDLEGQIAHLNATLRKAGVEAPRYSSGAYTRPPGL